eukprot:3043856-Pleurochrysis_carterae.AAC.2
MTSILVVLSDSIKKSGYTAPAPAGAPSCSGAQCWQRCVQAKRVPGMVQRRPQPAVSIKL